MTLPLLRIAEFGDETKLGEIQFNFDVLAKLFIDTGNLSIKVRFGQATVTWPGGSQNSNGTTVDHGMGSTPLVVVATNNSTGPWAHTVCSGPTSTQFTLTSRTTDGTSPALNTTQTVYWAAFG